ncbi:hypothetical protein BS78_07G231900 [Paspalum vaginatum]|nr:hypothetical protein BS78_07G231900 [Paspalum vaginatum]KAJ1269708.1 hypothetical protein BS78_07G231900 [Paspalum vaginatum]KAJ1269709.1 hypothetical protein BS78_07G231900 [Paspalum vaginatum]KAJ1269710.1 hypothetical protein BS78_07G231900 [Paspalum vaginatum]
MITSCRRARSTSEGSPSMYVCECSPAQFYTTNRSARHKPHEDLRPRVSSQPATTTESMASLARTAAAAAVRSAARSAPLTGRVLGAPLPSLASPPAARCARILRRSAAAGLETLMPLHSAVAAARLRSCIAVDSSCWSSLSQGLNKRI